MDLCLLIAKTSDLTPKQDARPGRTAQFMGGVMSEGQEVGVSSRAIFVAGGKSKL